MRKAGDNKGPFLSGAGETTPSPFEVQRPSTDSSYQPGGTGEWMLLGAVGLIPIVLFVLLIRRRFKREMDRPGRDHKGEYW